MKKNSFFFIFFSLFFSVAPFHAQRLPGADDCIKLRTVFQKNDFPATEFPLVAFEDDGIPFNIRIDIGGAANKRFQRRNEDFPLYFVFSTEEALENTPFLLKLMDTLELTYTNMPIHFLFLYGNEIPQFQDTSITGAERFVQTDAEGAALTAVCVHLNRKANAIIPGGGGTTSPAWLVRLVSGAFFQNRFFYTVRASMTGIFYRLNLLKDDDATALFLRNGIPSCGIELASFPSDSDYEKRMLNFFSMIVSYFEPEQNAEWDRHYIPFQIGNITYIFTENLSIIINVIVLFLILFIVCELSFFVRSREYDISHEVKRTWYIIPLSAFLTAVAFSLGQGFSLALYHLFRTNYYTLIAVKIVFAFALISFTYLVLIRFHLVHNQRVYSYLLTITSIMNIFLFSLADLSLFYLFFIAYLIIYISRPMKRTGTLSGAFLVLAVPFILFAAQFAVNADITKLRRAVFCPLYVNLVLSFAFLPFEFLWLRILLRLNLIWRHVAMAQRKVIRQNVSAIASAIGIFVVLLLVITLIIPEEYKKQSEEHTEHAILDEEDGRIRIDAQDSDNFGTITRTIQVQFEEVPECAELAIIGKDGNTVLHSELDFVSDYERNTDFFLLPSRPPKTLTARYIVTFPGDYEVAVRALFTDRNEERSDGSLVIEKRRAFVLGEKENA